jgi:hypothetical protein
MTPEEKKAIDGMDYETMLRLWRFCAAGYPYFQGETGRHFASVMARKRTAIGSDAAAQASKRIGWERR